MNDKYYELYKNYKTDFSISEVEPILNFSNYNTIDNTQPINKDILNKLAIVKLNGGLGTTMKCSKAKGCLEVIDDKTFLDIFINQVISVNNKPTITLTCYFAIAQFVLLTIKYLLDFFILSFFHNGCKLL